MTKQKKENVTVWSAVGMLIFGCALTTAGFIVEPLGEVSASVLTVLGQCLIFSGAALGIAAYTKSCANEAVREEMEKRDRKG